MFKAGSIFSHSVPQYQEGLKKNKKNFRLSSVYSFSGFNYSWL